MGPKLFVFLLRPLHLIGIYCLVTNIAGTERYTTPKLTGARTKIYIAGTKISTTPKPIGTRTDTHIAGTKIYTTPKLIGARTEPTPTTQTKRSLGRR